MKFKDESPIMFEIFQSDMEKYMYELNFVINNFGCSKQLLRMRDDFQHKIDMHKSRGEWL